MLYNLAPRLNVPTPDSLSFSSFTPGFGFPIKPMDINNLTQNMEAEKIAATQMNLFGSNQQFMLPHPPGKTKLSAINLVTLFRKQFVLSRLPSLQPSGNSTMDSTSTPCSTTSPSTTTQGRRLGGKAS